ncbi:MAG: DUF5610 domain-containing protein [Planctomycetota bacterium]
MNAITAPHQQAMLAGSRSSEQLQYRSMRFELALSDNTGRSVTLSVAAESLQFQGQYDRFGMVASGGASDRMLDQMRRVAGEEIAAQVQAQDGGRAQHSERVSLSAESRSLAVAGDADLLHDHFGAANTADRIYDFVGQLARKAGVEAGGAGFQDLLAQARKGVEQGFDAVEGALGALPEISKQTRAVLDRMFEQVRTDPSGPRPDAGTILDQMLAQLEQEADAS